MALVPRTRLEIRLQAPQCALGDLRRELVLDGHDHIYERFAPQTPGAVADPDRGIRQITVGTGGEELFTGEDPQPNSEVRSTSSYGVLLLTLHPTSYEFQFAPVAGTSFTDSGSGACHYAPDPPTGVTATPGNASAHVTWTAPGDPGAPALTSYTVTASPGGATVTTSTTAADVAGLTNVTS